MPTPKVLAFAGSTRKDSFNKKLIRIGAAGASAAGAEVTLIDLAEFPMPLYDGDLESEEGIPPNAKKFKELLKAHHGILISSPEYNSSIPAVLKNAIDWATRPEPNEPPLVAFVGKVAGLMAASPGGLGGLRTLATVRMILGNIQVLVLPDQVTVPSAHEAFNPDGSLKDEKKKAAVEALGRKVATITAKLMS
jgi:NAD(P)H-dependent FMN reductase